MIVTYGIKSNQVLNDGSKIFLQIMENEEKLRDIIPFYFVNT